MNQQNSNYSKENIIELLDGAVGIYPEIAPGIEEQKKIAADSSLPVDRRLEVYEDLMDSEVGDTTLLRARNVEREFGLRQLFLKFEGGNPSGTQKDRISFAQVMDALRRGFDTITLATCGNYGVACAFAASLAGIKCHIFLPQDFHSKRVVEMQNLGANIFRIPGDYESAVVHSRQYAIDREVYDANPGGTNTALQLRAYGEIAYEIYDELRDAPRAVAVPVSNGTTLAGIYKGFLSLYRRGKTSHMPRIIAGSSFRKNPIIKAFLDNLKVCENLQPHDIHETIVNEPLINWHSIDGDNALQAIRETNGWAGNASDKNLLSYSRMIREKEGLHVLPASTAGLTALLEKHKKEPLPNDRYVAILTGRNA